MKNDESKRFDVRVSIGKHMKVVGLMADGALKVRLNVAPEKGRANLALVGVLAEYFGVAKKDVRIVSGFGDRVKVVEVVGL